jgi:uncharacterized protein YbbC (DUF1343 family)
MAIGKIEEEMRTDIQVALDSAEMFKNIPQMKAFFETVAQKYQSHLDFLSTEREAIKARINKRGQ